MRYENWKIVFEEQRAPGTMRVWAEPFTKLRVPKLFDLRSDPYERADITSNTYYDWFLSQPYLIFAAQTEVAKFLATFKEFPPRQRPASFSVDQIIEEMQRSLSTPPRIERCDGLQEHVLDKDMLRRFEFERFSFDHVIPRDRQAL